MHQPRVTVPLEATEKFRFWWLSGKFKSTGKPFGQIVGKHNEWKQNDLQFAEINFQTEHEVNTNTVIYSVNKWTHADGKLIHRTQYAT